MSSSKRSTAAEPAYRRFRLNQRVQSDVGARLLDHETWQLGAKPIDEAMLRGKTCIAALDDAEKHDLAALAMVFIIDGIHYVNTGDWVESCTAIAETATGELELLRWHDTVRARGAEAPLAEVLRAA